MSLKSGRLLFSEAKAWRASIAFFFPSNLLSESSVGRGLQRKIYQYNQGILMQTYDVTAMISGSEPSTLVSYAEILIPG